MTARFDKLTLIDVADSRANKVSWKAIGEELNLTVTELAAIRKSSSYRITVAEVMNDTDADVSLFGVEKHMEGVVTRHAAEIKVEMEARKAEIETETTETTNAPTTEELTERLENLKARYTATFGMDLDGNEVDVRQVETTEVSTPTTKVDAFKAYKQAKVAFETYADSDNPNQNEVIRLNNAKRIAFETYKELKTEVLAPEVDSQEIESIKVKIDELYECNSKSGAVRRIRNIRRELDDLEMTDEVEELYNVVDKEAEFWMPGV